MSSRYASVLRLTSSTVTLAPSPTAILHAFAPTTPPPMIVTRPRLTPGTPPSSLPGHPAGDRRHRREQRQIAGRRLERLVRDAVDAAIEQLLAELLRRREMQVREQQQIFSHARELGRDRLLDLDDHVGLAPNLVGRRDDLRARGDVRLVGDRRADARVVLDQNGVAALLEDRDAGWSHADAIFLSLDLFGDADAHVIGRSIVLGLRDF